MKHIIFSLLFIPLIAASQEVNFHGLVPFRVLSVFDGDGFKGEWLTGQKGEIRLWGVDAPEKRGYSSRAQPYGNEAGDSLRALIKGKVVYLDTLTMKGNKQTDRFGRTVALCFLEDATNLNILIIERGWAWAKNVSGSRISNYNAVARNAQKEAKAAKLGLWDGKSLVSPTWWRANWSIFKN